MTHARNGSTAAALGLLRNVEGEVTHEIGRKRLNTGDLFKRGTGEAVETDGAASGRTVTSHKFHRIWFGKNPMPASYERYWDSWKRQYPDAEFITWTDADIDRLPLTRARLETISSAVCRADIARYEILYTFGGIYLDCDIMPHAHFDVGNLVRELTVCNETESVDYCSIGFIGAPAGHPVFLGLIEQILQSKIDEARPNVSTGPWLFGTHLRRFPHKRLPVRAFYPYLYDEPFSAIRTRNLDQTLGIHVWGGSWLPPHLKKNKAIQLLERGDIVEPSAIVADFEDQWAVDVRLLIETIQDVRMKSAEVAVVLSKDLSIGAECRGAFEFAKVVHWLLEQDADRMVWQIGAADGVLVDPLRPAMINFDPPAMLLEPNPYMFRMLEQGYRNNRNAKPLNVAYGTGESELVLNAINPEKAASLNLPRWVLGISSFYDDKNAIGGLTIDKATTRLIQSCIERITVPVIGFAALMELSNGRQPDILVIDAEGMDKPIIEDIIANGARPQVIHFEIQCMDESDRLALTGLLSQDYTLVVFGNDITAYRNDVIMDYAKAIYIQNGLPTIFAKALRKMNGLPQ